MPEEIKELLNAIEFAINHDYERLDASNNNRNPYNSLGDVVDELLPIAHKYGRSLELKLE